MYYYRARYYDCYIGRFLSADPIGYDDGMNVYAYCGNNPIEWADPSGLCKGDSLWDRWYDYWHKSGEQMYEYEQTFYETMAQTHREFVESMKYYGSNISKSLRYKYNQATPDAVGVNLYNLRGVLHQKRGLTGIGGFTEGKGFDIGRTIMRFRSGAMGEYTFSRGDDKDIYPVAGFEGSASTGVVIAWGRGTWQGTFINAHISPGPFGATYFESPDKSWRGVVISVGLGLGGAVTTTKYTGNEYIP